MRRRERQGGPDKVSGPARRRGLAAVELALCGPVLIALAFGMMECCNLSHVRTRMYSAAYEAARLATRRTTAENAAASSATVISYGQSVLTQLGVNGGQITLQPSDLSTVVPQQLVTVTVTAPLSSNSITSLIVNKSQTLTAQVTLVVE